MDAVAGAPGTEAFRALLGSGNRVGAVVFDQDGTLVDCWTHATRWLERVEGLLEAKGVRRGALAEAVGASPIDRSFDGASALAQEPWPALAARAHGVARKAGLPEAFDEELARFHVEVLASEAKEPKPPLVNLPELFGELRQRGIRVAVLTAADRASTEVTLRAAGVDGLVDAAVTCDDVLEAKPSGAPVLHICERLGVAPSQTLMVGDTAADLGAGRNAGVLLSVGVLSGFTRSAADLLAVGAGVVVRDISAVPALVDALQHASPSWLNV